MELGGPMTIFWLILLTLKAKSQESCVFFLTVMKMKIFFLKNKKDLPLYKEHHPTNPDQFFYTGDTSHKLVRGDFKTGRSKTILKGCETNFLH